MERDEAGYTLIELMIGLLVGLIVLSAVIYMFVVTLSSSKDVYNSTKLNQEMSTLDDLLVGELRRSGYWPATSSAVTSPFSSGTESQYLLPSSDCVLFTYDADGSQSISNSERHGFRLKNGSIDYRASGAVASNCTDGTWESITDPNFMDVTDFTVTASSSCLSIDTGASITCGTVSSGYVSVTKLNISVGADVKADTKWTSSFQDSVKLSNNKVIR